MTSRTYHQIISLCLSVVLLGAAFSQSSVAAETIVLVGSEGTKASLTGRWLDLIYTEVFRQLGYELDYQGYPNERAARMAEDGEVDGEIQRAASYEQMTQNLLKVEEPSFFVIVAAYAVTPGIVLDGWQSLKDTAYAVEYRRGSKLAENALPAVVTPDKLSAISTVEQGLKKLIAGRTDVFIEQELVVAEALKTLDTGEFDPSSIYQAGIMWKGASHLYLHKRHAALLPKIAEVLKAMKHEGVIEQYKDIAQSAQ